MKLIEKNAWFIVIVLFVLLWMFSGCQQSTVKAVPTTIVIGGVSVNKYWIDSCLYFGRKIGDNTGVFTHAGTCPNPMHKCKCD